MQILLCCHFYVNMFFWGMDQRKPPSTTARNCIKVTKSVAEVVSLRIFEASFGGIFFLVLKPSSTETPPFSTSMIIGLHLRTRFFLRKEKWSTEFWKNRSFFHFQSSSSLFWPPKKLTPKKGHRWKSSGGRPSLGSEVARLFLCVKFWGLENITRRGTADITRWWFQIFFIFTPIWGRFPIWLIFFKWVETTNQIVSQGRVSNLISGGVGVFICGPYRVVKSKKNLSVSGVSRLKGVLVTLTDCRASKRCASYPYRRTLVPLFRGLGWLAMMTLKDMKEMMTLQPLAMCAVRKFWLDNPWVF